mgnify:CR=1 FL=1
MSVDVGSAVGYLDLDISGFLAGLKTAQTEANKQTKSIAEKVGANVSGIGKKLESAGKTLTKSVTVPIVGAGAAIYKMSSRFEAAMSKVQAISGASTSEFEVLNKKAQELGATTEWSAYQVAEGMTEMAKAGWSTQQILDGMSGVLDAASASGENLASVSTIVADAITGFGLKAKDATRVADLLTQAANAGTIDISDLGESFKYISPVANAMGLSIEDITTAISAMSMAGIKGSQAGTSLRTMLTRMVKPTNAVEAAMDDLGITLADKNGNFKSLNTIVAEMRGSFNGLTDEQKAYYAAVLAGQEGMSGLLALLNLTEDEYNAISDSMQNASGVARETANIMLNNLSGQITILKSALEGLAIQFGEVILPYLKKFVKWLQTLVQKMQEMTPEQKEQIVKWAAFAAAIGPALLIIGKLSSSIGGMITTFIKMPAAITKVKGAFTAFSVVIGGISAPVIAVIAVIGVLIAAFTNLWKNSEDFRNKITSIWNQLKESFEKLTSGIVERLNALGFDFENITEVIKAIWDGFCNYLAPIFEGVFQAIADFFDFIVNSILNTLDFWIAIFSGDWEGAWNAVKSQFENIWNAITNFFKNIVNTLKGIFDAVLGWFGTSWDECWTSISDFFINIWNGITSFLSSAWETIKNVVKFGIMFIGSVLDAAFKIITLPFRFIWENCKETIISVWNSIIAFLTSILTSIVGFFSTVWNGIKAIVTTAVNNVKAVITNVFNAIKTFVTNIWNNIKDAISGPINAAKNTVSNIVDTIKNKITSGFTSAKNTVTNIFNSIKDAISSPINKAKEIVSNAVDNIKKKFDFKWSFPKLKMPHFSIKGKFSLNPPSVPKLNVEWYKKAMGNGIIMNSPTIFGFNSKTGKFLAGGETGSETVVGTKSLLNMIKQSVREVIGPLVSASYEIARTSAELGYITYDGFVKLRDYKEKWDEKWDESRQQNNNRDGDTFVFYSNKSIDEVEAAKQMKKTKRELAEGF